MKHNIRNYEHRHYCNFFIFCGNEWIGTLELSRGKYPSLNLCTVLNYANCEAPQSKINEDYRCVSCGKILVSSIFLYEYQSWYLLGLSLEGLTDLLTKAIEQNEK